MSEQSPRPIRLTKRRAEALLDVISIGIDQMETALRQDLRATADADAVGMNQLRERDHWLLSAKDAAAIIRHRYAGGEAPVTPTPPLF